ncbi:MAG TPA: GGDEF domain-containing protein [Anaerolineales bacterium]|nr:GGDEF domain-containing protein [Anaerolineales bacterium]
MLPTRRSTLLGQIDPLRQRMVAVLSLGMAAVTLSLLALVSFVPTLAPTGGPGFSLLLGLEAGLCMVAAALAHFNRREWAARLLALNLVVLPTIEVVRLQAPLDSALAGYVGVLLVLAIGTRPLEVLIGTLTVAIFAALLVRAQGEPQFLAQSLISVTGLLAGTGVILAWLIDALRRAIVGLEASEAHFHHLSHTDPLTGLGNRRLFDDTLAGLLAANGPSLTPALVVLDVDTLKQINDRHGHPAGDNVLRSVAASIQGSIRDQDIACRVGGDEFAVILAWGGLRGAQQVAARIYEKLPSMLRAYAGAVDCTVSLGVAERGSPGQTPAELLAAADAQLYANRNHVRKPVRQIAEPPRA